MLIGACNPVLWHIHVARPPGWLKKGFTDRHCTDILTSTAQLIVNGTFVMRKAAAPKKNEYRLHVKAPPLNTGSMYGRGTGRAVFSPAQNKLKESIMQMRSRKSAEHIKLEIFEHSGTHHPL